MEGPQSVQSSVPLVVGGTVIFLAGLVVWTVVAVLVARGARPLPFVRRRPVPWQAAHVAAISAAYLLVGLLVRWVDVEWFGLPVADSAKPATGVARVGQQEVSAREHPLVILLSRSPSLGTLALCFVAAVLVAPVAEEFLFRLVLQGWLEAVETRHGRRLAWLRRLPRGSGPVVLASVVFGAMHYRAGIEEPDPRLIALQMASSAVASVVVLAFGIGLLVCSAKARAADLGFVWRRLPHDMGLGVAVFFGFAAMIYLLRAMLSVRLGENVADPLVLFLFAMILGTLYFRTHRLVPSIALHMSLNLTSLTMAWFGAGT